LNFVIPGPIIGLVVGLAIFGLGNGKGHKISKADRGSRQNNLRGSIGLTGHSSSAAVNVHTYGTCDPAIH
jgi:hypothetical protein